MLRQVNAARYFNPDEDGFQGAYYPHPKHSQSVMLYMLGPSVDSFLVKIGVPWMHELGCSVMALSPEPMRKGFYDLPLERFGAAIRWLKAQGYTKIGVAGASVTGMLALLAAAYYPEDISLTIAISPCDFVMEGYYRDGLDGASERPGDNQSTVTWQGQPLPYLPFAYRHPDYWQKLQAESHATGNLIASREMFDLSEQLHPITDAEAIPVERIRGTLVLAGAKDDCLWDTCRYIRRMRARMLAKNAPSRCQYMLYEHGTHFLFPQSLLVRALPLGNGLPICAFRAGRQHIDACKASRVDFDRRLSREIIRWRGKRP